MVFSGVFLCGARLMLRVNTPIAGLHPAKTPPTALGESVETAIGGTLVLALFAAFLWSPVLIEWLDQF